MKNLKYLIFIIPFLFLSNVKADDIVSRDYYLFENDSTFFNNFDYSSEFIDIFSKQLIAEWEKKYKEDWPYYYISIIRVYNNDSVDFGIRLGMLKAIPVLSTDNVGIFRFGTFESKSYPGLFMYFKGSSLVSEEYNGINSSPYLSWVSCSTGGYVNQCATENIAYNYYLFSYYDSNFDMLSGFDFNFIVKDIDGTELFSFNKGSIIPTYKSKFINKTDLNYTEINLNNYPYIALSLKDYSKTEEFNSMTYVKGQYCLTSVYNYGLIERKDILVGTQMQRCSLYYDEYTPIRTYILKSDLENHSIYYLKAYDTSKENKIKVDTSVFNIHYITEEEKDNPIITIDGKKYTTIPYDELTDTATKSEDENYASGGSCAVGDFNCTSSLVGSTFSWSDIFTSPLDFLKNIWTSISQVFVIITYFISLLPTTLQYFFYVSFTLVIILGIIKIIL